MSLNFQIAIVSPTATTYSCELFHGPPYSDRELHGHIDPLQTAPLTGASGKLTTDFSTNIGNGYALRVRAASGKILARTNARMADSKKSLVVIDGTVRISESEFGQFAPTVPFTEGKTTFDRVTLDFVGKDLRLLAHAVNDGVINKKFTFDYRFRLVPVDIPVWTADSPKDEVPEDTLTIDATSLTIDADKNRQELLMGLLHPIIKAKLRKTVQRRFHDSIQKQAAASALKSVVTLIGTEVVDGKHIDLKIGILADAPG